MEDQLQEVAELAPGIIAMIHLPSDSVNASESSRGCDAPCECDCDCYDAGPADDDDYE